MNPKDGKAGSPVSPTEAKAALDADLADPGKMAELKSVQRQAKKGKYDPVKTQPHNAGAGGKSGAGPGESGDEKKSWIEIELIDDEKRPVPGARYLVTLPDETIAEGTLDEKGFARIEGITPGNCKISFPAFDQGCWKTAGASGGGGKPGGQSGGGKSGGGKQGSADDGGKSGGSESSFKDSGGQSGKAGGGGESSSVKGGDPGGSKG